MTTLSPLTLICIVIWIASVVFAVMTGMWSDPVFLMIAAFSTKSVWSGVIP